jgi:hypothetical protein
VQEMHKHLSHFIQAALRSGENYAIKSRMQTIGNANSAVHESYDCTGALNYNKIKTGSERIRDECEGVRGMR